MVDLEIFVEAMPPMTEPFRSPYHVKFWRVPVPVDWCALNWDDSALLAVVAIASHEKRPKGLPIQLCGTGQVPPLAKHWPHHSAKVCP